MCMLVYGFVLWRTCGYGMLSLIILRFLEPTSWEFPRHLFLLKPLLAVCCPDVSLCSRLKCDPVHHDTTPH